MQRYVEERILVPLLCRIAHTRPGFSLDSSTPAFWDGGEGYVSEDSDLAIMINRSSEGSSMRKSQVDSVGIRHDLFEMYVKVSSTGRLVGGSFVFGWM